MPTPARSILRVRDLSAAALFVAVILVAIAIFRSRISGEERVEMIGMAFLAWLCAAAFSVVAGMMRCPECKERLLTFEIGRQLRFPLGNRCPWCEVQFTREAKAVQQAAVEDPS